MNTFNYAARDQRKPFNSIMMECFYQEYIYSYEDDIYYIETQCEQIKNHPPTSLYCIQVSKVINAQKALQIKQDFQCNTVFENSDMQKMIQITGESAYIVKINTNTAVIIREGNSLVELYNQQQNIQLSMRFNFPKFVIKGLLHGSRYCYYRDTSCVLVQHGECNQNYILQNYENTSILNLFLQYSKQQQQLQMFALQYKQHNIQIFENILMKNKTHTQLITTIDQSVPNCYIDPNVIVINNNYQYILSESRNFRKDIKIFIQDQENNADQATKIKSTLEQQQRDDRIIRGCE